MTISFCPHQDELPRATVFNAPSCSVDPAAVRPYHTLLLRQDRRRLLKRLPDDSNPALRRLVEKCTPLKNLEEVAVDIDIQLSQLLRLCVHLVVWHGTLATGSGTTPHAAI